MIRLPRDTLPRAFPLPAIRIRRTPDTIQTSNIPAIDPMPAPLYPIIPNDNPPGRAFPYLRRRHRRRPPVITNRQRMSPNKNEKNRHP